MTRDVADRYRGFLASIMPEIAPGVYVAPELSKAVRQRIQTVLTDWWGTLPGGSIVMGWKDGCIHSVAHHQNAGSGLGRRNRLRGNPRGIIQQGEKSQSYGFGAPGATRGLQLFRAKFRTRYGRIGERYCFFEGRRVFAAQGCSTGAGQQGRPGGCAQCR